MDDLIKYWILCLVKALLWSLDFIGDLLFGVTISGGSKADRIKAQSYESSAQLVKVLWKEKQHFVRPPRLSHFLYMHEEYISPNYILKNKNVSLMVVEKECAVFCVSDPSIDMYDTEIFPFTVLSQWFTVQKLIILPITSFHRLADQLGDPKVPVTAAAMTARCGSTLLVQLFNKVPKTRALSEPFACCYVHELRGRGEITPEESRKYLRSTMRLQCKVEPGADVERIFIKMTIENAPQLADLADMFPQFTYFFNTRHPVPSIKSMKTIFKDNFISLYHSLGLFWRYFAAFGFAFSYDGKYDKVHKRLSKLRQNVSDDEFSILFYVNSIVSYFDNKSMFKRVVFYENLASNPKEEVEEMFKLSNIPMEHVPTALEALKHDSQKGTLGKQGKARSTTIDKELLLTFDEYMKDCNMSFIRHDMSVEEFKAAFA